MLSDFIQIEPENLRPNTVLDFDIYVVNSDNRFVLYRKKDLSFTESDRKNLISSVWNKTFIRYEHEKQYNSYLEESLKDIIFDRRTPVEKKAKILYRVSTNLIKELLEKPEIHGAISRSKNIAEATITYLLQSELSFLNFINIISHDYYTYTHSVNVCTYSIALGQKIGVKSNELVDLGMGALLHDIGKSKIDVNILNKVSPLDTQEWEIIKKHPTFGKDILLNSKDATECQRIAVFQHHEKCNGRGYPHGFTKQNIHTYGRMLAISDVFDALTTNRPYKRAMQSFDALKLMTEEMEGHFDLNYLRQFILILEK